MITVPAAVLGELDSLAARLGPEHEDLQGRIDELYTQSYHERWAKTRPVELPIELPTLDRLLERIHDVEWCTCGEGYYGEDGWVDTGCNWWGWDALDCALKTTRKTLLASEEAR